MPGSPIHLHLVRFGTAADQEYFLGDWQNTYDQIVVNANMVAHMPSALSTFLAFRAQKPYFIDPQTHGFQHEVEHLLSESKDDEGNLKIKRSWQGLAEAYGSPVQNLLVANSPRSLLPEDLSDSDVRKGFCLRVLAFQRDKISAEATTGQDAEYVKYYAEDAHENKPLFHPSVVIAPYFYLSHQFFDAWLAVNLSCLSSSREAMTEGQIQLPMAAQIVVARETLSSEKRLDALIKAYSQHPSNPEVFMIWIDSFSEQEASADELSAFIKLVKGLSARGRSVVNLYGGYFSVASARFGELKDKLTGVCHGLEYGESKPVVPISGGVPVAKFYLPALHSRLHTRVAVRAIRALNGFATPADFHALICDCSVCKTVITTDPEKDFGAYAEVKTSTFWRSKKRVSMEFPTAKASDLCAQHYLKCKHREYTEDKKIGPLCDELLTAFETLKGAVGLEHVGHTSIWPGVLNPPAA